MYHNELFPNNLNHIWDYLMDGILLLNNNGEIIFYNKALLNLYKLPKSEMNTKKPQDLLENHDMNHSFLELALKAKKQITYEQTLKNQKMIITTLTPILDLNDTVTLIIAHCRNFDDLKFYAPNSSLFNLPIPPQQKKNKPQVLPTLAEFKSPAMQNIYRLADNMASKNINILILGNSGTGKSQLAQRIHQNSPRKEGPFVTINCSTIPENLIESELFGYVKGAFSGALNTGKKGLVEVANEGTLFLDEIGELPFSLQSKLLQLVQDKTYLPIGGVHPKQVDTRIVAATNKDILSLISQGTFREDLYYRLAVVTILMPSLAERIEDILLLIRHFSNIFNLKHDTNVVFSKDTLEILCHYSWPGNIRELEHLIEFLILNSQDKYITPNMLPNNIYSNSLKTQNSINTFTEEVLVSQNDKDSNSEATFKEDTSIDSFSNLSEIESFESFLEAQEERLINALYPYYNTSYKLASRLKISQSKASRLIRKYIKNK
ncbi:sigma-54 interaction domain-containing protein [Anaerovorax sp. IOR16]|uniref:sigma-54 interaction domain-containing protein n=1 Tax=Anaerovorax sp. IOR16 TaxID=2773458 RepID=UPI0019CFF03A|nr:sigma 54-interacting transcriptional regulator [Anaerovorax sp. IOR16]